MATSTQLRLLLPAACVALAVVLILVGRSPAVAAASGPFSEAVTTYLADCATCHGDEGEGTNRGPSLLGVGAASVDYQLRTGRMPIDDPRDETKRSPPAYPPERIAALVELVAGFGPGGVPIPSVDLRGADVAAGGEIFRLQCAACHQWSGGGGALLYSQAPRLGPADPVTVAEAVRVGPGTMPPFGRAALDEEELADVIAYVAALDDPRHPGGSPLGYVGPLAEGAVAWVVGAGTVLLGLLWMGKRAGA